MIAKLTPVSKPSLTELGIHNRLKSCVLYYIVLFVVICAFGKAFYNSVMDRSLDPMAMRYDLSK